jgi:anti-sigma factor RsiW
MTCRTIRKLIPLAAGDDLRPRLAAAVRAHIAGCPGCRSELEAFRAALAAIRAEARATGAAEWTDAEWRAAMSRVAAAARGESRERGRATAPSLRTRWAAAAALGALLGLAVMGVLFKGPAVSRGGPEGLALAAGTPKEQDRMSITLVSPESGLQVVWFLDKNFEWKGDNE